MEPTILVVEDDDDDVFALKWTLKRTGVPATLQIVRDGLKAVSYLAGTGDFADRRQFPLPDLILLDLKLPFRSGHEILAWLAGQDRLRDIPVIVLSGSDESTDRDRALEMGATGYLVKPPSEQALAELLARFDARPAVQ